MSLVIGGRDMEAGNVSVRLHGNGNVGPQPKGEVIADILAAIVERREQLVSARKEFFLIVFPKLGISSALQGQL